MKMEQTECSETSAYKIQTPGNYPEENIQHFRNWISLHLQVKKWDVTYSAGPLKTDESSSTGVIVPAN